MDNDGTYVQRVKKYTLQSADVYSYTTSPTNNDYALVNIPTDMIPRTLNENSGALFTEFRVPAFAVYTDTIGEEGKHFYGTGSYTSDKIVFVFANGTYANITEARAFLVGKELTYQLATPIETETGLDITTEDFKYLWRMYKYLLDNTKYPGFSYLPAGNSKYDVAYVNKTIDEPFAELNGHTLREVFEGGKIETSSGWVGSGTITQSEDEVKLTATTDNVLYPALRNNWLISNDTSNN
jgi:hypothetical protein